jgi:hypothetical protein
MTLHLNPTQAAPVTAYEYGPEQTNAEGETYREVIGVKPGVRLDVQIKTIERHPALMALAVEPANPVHDPGPTGVRLIAESIEVFQAAAPATGHHHDLFWDDGET